MLRRLVFVAALFCLIILPVASHADRGHAIELPGEQGVTPQPSSHGLILAQVGPGPAGKEEDPRKRIRGIGRFVPGDPQMRVAELLLDVKNGKTGEYFYKELGKIGKNNPDVNMLLINSVKTAIGQIGGDMLLEQFLGRRFEGRQGTPVEALIGTYRRDLTNKAIAEVIKDSKIQALAARNNSRVFLAFVGKWASQSPQDFTFSGDIDFSFVGGNGELIVAMRDLFNEIIVRETGGLTMKQLDSFATAHGFATSDVYVGEAGRRYGDDEIVKGKVSLIDFERGGYDLNSHDGTTAIFQSVVEEAVLEASKRDGIVDKTLSIYFEKLDARANTMTEPMISMEMIRHLEHDIILHSESFPALDTIVKGCKYLYRSNLYFTKQFGVDPGNRALADFATKMTQMAKSASPGDMAAAVVDYFKQSGIAQSPADVDYVPGKDGKPKAVLSSNREKALAFLQDCMKNMWGNVQRGLRIHLDELNRKKADYEEKTKRGATDEQTLKDMEAFRKKLSQLLKGIKTELEEFEKGKIELPTEVKSLCQEVVRISEDIGKITGMRKLTVEEEKQLEMVKKLLQGEPAENTRAMALSTMMDLANKFIQRTNARLDWIDDTIMGPLRGDPSFEDFIRDIHERNKLLADLSTIDDPAVKARIAEFQGTLTNRFRKKTYDLEVALNTLIYKNAVARGVKKINVAMNDFIQSTQSGRAAMAGLTAFNLTQEFSAYTQAFSRDGFSGFAAEIIRRRVPFGSAAENLYQGKYLLAGWDTLTTIFPPLALPFAAKGVADYAATATVSYLWSSDLELLIDGLYGGASWEMGKTQDVMRFQLVAVTYKKMKYERLSLEKGETFILQPDVDTVLWANLAQGDPFLELYEKLQKHPAASQKVKDHFLMQYQERWLNMKKAYVKHMIEKLEKRKNAEVAISAGKIAGMYDELMDIAGKLAIKSQVNAAMDAEWDSDNLKALWGWLKNAKRTMWGQPLAEQEATRAAAIVMTYLETYRAVLAARTQVEGAVAGVFEKDGQGAPPIEQQRQRVLTGIAFLTGRAREDGETAKPWKAFPAALDAAVEQELLSIKAESVEDAKLDSPYDRETHGKVFFEDYWIKALEQMKVPVIAAGSVKDAMNKRAEARKKLVKDYRDHYALQKGTATVYVRQQHGSKRTELPVTNAHVVLKAERAVPTVLEHRGEGQYTKSGFKPGAYVLTVKADGFTATADGKKHEASYTVKMPSPKESKKGLDPITVYLIVKDRGKQALDVSVTPATAVIKESGEGSTLTLTPIVVPKKDSGKLNFQWATDGKVLRSGKDVSVDEITPITFSGEGRAGKDVKVTLVVFDEKDRQGIGESVIKVVSPGLTVRLKPHRTVINKDQSEFIEVEEPRAADESFQYIWKITGDGVGIEKALSSGYMINGPEYAGKKLSITVVVTDKFGSTGQAATTVSVKEEDSQAKILVTISPQSATIAEDGQIELTVMATPFKDSGRLSFNGVAMTPGTNSYRFTYSGKDTTYAPPVTTSFMVTVRDEKGRMGEVVARIHVTKKQPAQGPPNGPPDSGAGTEGAGGKGELSFSGTAFDIWEGGNTPEGFLLRRIEAKGGRISEPCPHPAGVWAEAWGKIHSFRSLRTQEDIAKKLNEELEGYKAYRWRKEGTIRDISLGDFKGLFLDTKIRFGSGGWSPETGVSPCSIDASGHGYVMKGERVVELGYSVGGSGCFDNSQRPFLESQGATAQSEAKAIMAGLRLAEGGVLSKVPYKGPKLDGSDLPRVVLVPSKIERLKIGDVVKLQAVVEKAKPEDSPFKYTWTGDFQGSGNTVTIKTTKPGKFTLAVSVDGARYNLGSASIEYEVADFKVKIERVPVDNRPVPVGGKVHFKATLTADGQPASGNYVYRWQPHPEVSFSPFEGSSTDADAVFTRLEKTKVWVQVLEQKGKVLSTVAESDQIEIDVIQPKLKLVAEPTDPYVGKEVKVTVTENPKMDDKTIDFWWEIAGNALNPGPLRGNRQYTFRPKDTRPITVTVHAKAKDGGADLGEEKVTVTGKPYQVNARIIEKFPKPKVFDPAQKGFVEASRGTFVTDEQVTAEAEVVGGPPGSEIRWNWVGNTGTSVSNPASSSPALSRHEKGTAEATVTARDKDGVVLGSTTVSFSVTVSADERKASASKEAAKKLAEARKLLSEGKIDRAITVAEEAARIDPKAAAPVLKELAQASKKSGWAAVNDRDFEKAIKGLENAVRLDPSDRDAQEKLRKVKKWSDIWDRIVRQEIPEFDRLIGEKKPFSAHKQLIKIQEMGKEMHGGGSSKVLQGITERMNKALEEYRGFRKTVEERYTEYFREKDWESGLKLVQETLKRELSAADEKQDRDRLAVCRKMLGQQKEVWGFYQRTKTDFEQGRIKDGWKAAQELKDKTNVYGNNAPQRRQMLDLAKAIEKSAEDREKTKAAMDKKKKSDDLLARGTALQDQKKHKEATASFSQAIELNPNNGEAYRRRGVSKRETKDHRGAVQDFTRAIELDPKNSKAYAGRGGSRGAMGDIRGAIDDYTRAIEMDPQYESAHYNRGFYRSKLGDHAGAIADYDRAIAINPKSSEAYNNRGFAKEKLSDLRGALSDYERALAINSSNAPARRNAERVRTLLAGGKASTGTETGKSKGEGAVVGTVPSAKIFTSKVWQFGRGDGTVLVSKMRLLPDGRIGGANHPNESRWAVVGNELLFYDAAGKVATRYNTFKQEGGRWVISGPFLLWGNITHVLKEVK